MSIQVKDIYKSIMYHTIGPNTKCNLKKTHIMDLVVNIYSVRIRDVPNSNLSSKYNSIMDQTEGTNAKYDRIKIIIMEQAKQKI